MQRHVMETDQKLDNLTLDATPYGKVIGVVKSRVQLQAVTEALANLGVLDVEVLGGATGIELLNSEQDAVSQCFLGDMEAEMIARYLLAVKNGEIVFAAVTEPATADQAAEAAKAHGASAVVYFGNWVITNY